jgi:hypothetical protein
MLIKLFLCRVAMSSSMDLLKLLECPICLQTLELPESLPCLHTFCALCIREHIAKSTNRVVCPICRQAVPISSNLNSVLKKDFFKAEMLELLGSTSNFSYECGIACNNVQ